ncbi:hypothetical protein GCM10010278_65370 [Streptomyces melanogenes]|nr:hypothetical protein GCM10010278_65370 [Streptomyces melanogenes]
MSLTSASDVSQCRVCHIKKSTYHHTTGRRLHAAAGEACRLAYDSGRMTDGEKLFAASLRAPSTSGDVNPGAATLAFWANLR